MQRILRWAEHVARGREDREQTMFVAELVEGGTIEPIKIRALRCET